MVIGQVWPVYIRLTAYTGLEENWPVQFDHMELLTGLHFLE